MTQRRILVAAIAYLLIVGVQFVCFTILYRGITGKTMSNDLAEVDGAAALLSGTIMLMIGTVLTLIMGVTVLRAWRHIQK